MRIVADPRTNQVIVNASPVVHHEIDALLQRLDVPDAAKSGGKKFPRLPGDGK